MPGTAWDELTFPFPNYKGFTVEILFGMDKLFHLKLF